MMVFIFTFQSTKFGEKKTNNCSWNMQKSSEGPVYSSVFEDCSQASNSLNCSQAQPHETFSCSLQVHSQITKSSEPNSFSLHCQQTNGSKDSISFSPMIFSPANNLKFNGSISKEIGNSSIISQSTKVPSLSHELLNISSQRFKNLRVAPQKLKNVRVPLTKTASAEVNIPRRLESHHIKLEGIGTPCLLSKCTLAPPTSRAIGKSSYRGLSIYSQKPYQRTCKKLNEPSLVNNEVSGFSLPAKVSFMVLVFFKQ